ncbi:MAG: ATP-binding cassette domain-containing protein [Promethearchaeota archaeon]
MSEAKLSTITMDEDENNDNILVIKDLTKIFPHPSDPHTKIPILSGVNQKFTFNQLNFLMGASGSGKSTFIRMILGVSPVSAGEISFKNYSIHKLHIMKYSIRADYWSRIGYVNQFPAKTLCLDLSIKENLSLYQHLGIKKGMLNLEKMNYAKYLKFFNLSLDLNTPVRKLSGGEIQRLNLACVLIKLPKLILCDEPTSQLDYENKINIINILEKYRELNNACVLITTHNEEITRNHKLFILKNGKIQEI